MQPVTMYTYLRINKGYARLKETGMSFCVLAKMDIP